MHSPEAGSFNRFGIMRQIRPVFAHADPAEVAQAKALAETAADQVVKLLAQLRDANDKLAERDALLQRAYDADQAARHHLPCNVSKLMDEIESVLSASAEPSAPVEPVCNCATRLDTNHALSCPRATLERRPS